MDVKEWGPEAIRDLRRRRRQSLRELAADLGVSHQAVWLWETNRGVPTRYRTIRALDALDRQTQ